MSAISNTPTRALFMGGNVSPYPIDLITMSTQGNATDFGDVTTPYGMQCSNAVRGLYGGGDPHTNLIEFVTMSTLGNAVDFGDLTVARYYGGSTSSPTRGIWWNGWTPSRINTIDYVQIMSEGNAIDFGDATIEANAVTAGLSNGHGGL